MIASQHEFIEKFQQNNIDVYCPDVVQTMDEEELIHIVPEYDGWIIGDDPATKRVFEAGKKGKLKAAVKWGIGVDNVDFSACQDLDIPITNTPNMFGPEVADIAIGYVIALARETFRIDREIRHGKWPKYPGISLAGKKVALIGYGDIGKNTAIRLRACGLSINVYDPEIVNYTDTSAVRYKKWPDGIEECDFLLFTCALNSDNIHMLNSSSLAMCKRGVRVVNVARGPLIDEQALINALQSGQVHSAALDVFENEPLSVDSELMKFPSCIFGSHNGSNTKDAVTRTNERAINELFHFLEKFR